MDIIFFCTGAMKQPQQITLPVWPYVRPLNRFPAERLLLALEALVYPKITYLFYFWLLYIYKGRRQKKW